MRLKDLFSVKAKLAYNECKIKLKFFGIKININVPVEAYTQKNYVQNESLVTSLIANLKLADDNDLFCLKNNVVCFIFNKNVLKWGISNFTDFVYNSFWTLHFYPLEFKLLNENTSLYKEHINRSRNNEFLWKYKLYGSKIILHKFLSFDDENNYYINDTAFIPDKSANTDGITYTENCSKRKFIEGITFYNYISELPYEIKKKETIRLVQFILDKYTIEGDILDSVLVDCHFNNIIIDKNGEFHYIDNDRKSKKPIDKEYVLNYLFRYTSFKRLQEEVLEHFGVKKLYEVVYQPDTSLDTATDIQKLREKYFINPK